MNGFAVHPVARMALVGSTLRLAGKVREVRVCDRLAALTGGYPNANKSLAKSPVKNAAPKMARAIMGLTHERVYQLSRRVLPKSNMDKGPGEVLCEIWHVFRGHASLPAVPT